MIFLCDNFVKISVMKRHSLRALNYSCRRDGVSSHPCGVWRLSEDG